MLEMSFGKELAFNIIRFEVFHIAGLDLKFSQLLTFS